MSMKVGTVFAELGLDDGPFQRGLLGAGGHLGGLTKAGIGAAAGITGALTGAAVYSLLEFGKMEKGMNEVFTLLPGISEQSMGEMRSHVQSLSAKMGVMTDDMVPALYQSLSAGVPKDNVFDFLETATKAGIAGVATTEDSVSALTTGMNIFGESAEEVGDALFTTVKLGLTTFPQLVSALGTVGPAAKASGVSLDELSASVATAIKKIPDTAKVSTSLVQVFSELDKEGSKINDTLQEMGHTTVASAKKEFGSFQGVLQAIYKQVGSNETAFKNLFGSTEGAGVALTLVGEGAEIAASDLAAMASKAGATEAAFNTMDQGLSRSMDKIKANVQVMVQKAGQILAPFAAEVAGAIEGATPKVQEFADRINRIWDRKDITVTAKLDVAWDEFGKLNETTFEIKKNIDGITHALLGVGHAVAGVIDMLKLLWYVSGTVGQELNKVILEFGIAGMTTFDKLAGAMQRLNLISDQSAQSITDSLNQMKESHRIVTEEGNKHWQSAANAADSATQHFQAAGSNFKATVDSIQQEVPPKVTSVEQAIEQELAKLPPLGTATGQGMTGNLAANIAGGTPGATGAAAGAASGIQGTLLPLPAFGTSIGSGTMGGLTSGMASQAGGPPAQAEAAKGGITGAFASPHSLLNSVGSIIVEGLIDGMGAMLGPVASMAARIEDTIRENKGPIEKDRKLLVPAGLAIMDGLIGSIGSRQGALAAKMSEITGMVRIPLNGGFGLVRGPAFALSPSPTGAGGGAGGGNTTNSHNKVSISVTSPISNEADADLLAQKLAWQLKTRGY